MNTFKKLKQLLHGQLDIYENFDYEQYPNTLSPGSMPANDLLQKVVEEYNPKIIIEIGSFLGYSASGMAKKMKQLNPDSAIICVDTWMGGSDHWHEVVFNTNSRIKRVNGYPTLYYNFLANMCYEGLQETVIPFAYPSITAAAILQTLFSQNDIKADMIYVDGSHLALDVYFDCDNYWPLLKKGGVMFGDDWTCDDVKLGVMEFTNKNNLDSLTIHPNNVHWFIKK